jgi:hypothetical protein
LIFFAERFITQLAPRDQLVTVKVESICLYTQQFRNMIGHIFCGLFGIFPSFGMLCQENLATLRAVFQSGWAQSWLLENFFVP